MSTLSELMTKLNEAKRTHQAAKKALEDFEPDDREAETRYNEYLREAYGDIDVCGMSMDAADVLKQMDPVAYRTGRADWLDGEDLSTFGGYVELEEALDDAQAELDGIQSDIDELTD